MIRKLALCLALCLALLLALCPAALADSEEEVSISIFDAEATPAPEEEQAEEPVDPTQPVYEADGSILLTMSFTGDVTIGANMQSDSRIFEKELKKQKGDINFPFRNVKEIFEADDLTMVNFEGTLTTAGRNKSKLDNDFLFRADPGYVTMLPDNGIDTVSLENNHVLDMGEDGLEETKKTLLEAGVSYASEDEPAILTVKGVKIGSLAYQTFGGRHDEIIAKLPGDIQALRDQGCQIVIVSYHWGAELDYAPNDNQVRLGRATIDAGADLVIGHHSHRINPIEYYNGKYICYSLGNFCFGVILVYSIRSLYFADIDEACLPVHLTGRVSGILSCFGYLPDVFLLTLTGSWLDSYAGKTGYNMIFVYAVAMGLLCMIISFSLYCIIKKKKQSDPQGATE